MNDVRRSACCSYDSKDALIQVGPREGEYTIREEDILKALEEHGDTIATVLIGGTGQKRRWLPRHACHLEQ